MTRGYVCIVKSSKVIDVAYLSSDAYISYYGYKILEAINTPTTDKGIKAYLKELEEENIEYGYEDDCKDFALNWIKPDKISRSYDDWNYAEYGYIYDASNYMLKIYHNGKLLFKIDTDNQEEIDKYMYIFENENKIYTEISYDEDMLDDVVDFDKCMKLAASKDIDVIKQYVSDNDSRSERIYLRDYHCIAPGHRAGHEVYQKILRWEYYSECEELKFIVEHNATEYSDYGWNALIQTPFVRIPIRVGGKTRFSSERALMKSLRLFVKENSSKLAGLVYIMSYFKGLSKKGDTYLNDLIKHVDSTWEANHWYVTDGYLTPQWFKREIQNEFARRIKLANENLVKQLEQATLEVEANDLEFTDGEIEIQMDDGNVVICEYAESQLTAMQRKVFAPVSDFANLDDIRKLCNKHSWYCVG